MLAITMNRQLLILMHGPEKVDIIFAGYVILGLGLESESKPKRISNKNVSSSEKCILLLAMEIVRNVWVSCVCHQLLKFVKIQLLVLRNKLVYANFIKLYMATKHYHPSQALYN